MRILFFLFLAGRALAAPIPAALDAWCGSAQGELPDLWERVWFEWRALTEVPAAAAWDQAPARVGVLLRNFALFQRGTAGQEADLMRQVEKAHQALLVLRPRLVTSASAHETAGFTQLLAQARSQLETVRDRYPPGSLDFKRSAPNTTPLSIGSTLILKASTPRLVVDQPAEVKLQLRDAHGRGVSSLDLAETHTRKLHAFLIDSSLEDYHHEHPITAGPPGVFSFIFTPHRDGDYFLWLDVMPSASGRNEFPRTRIPGAQPALHPPIERNQMECSVDGFHYELRLDGRGLRAGQMANGRLRVTDAHGLPCFNLEPVMGAFAHYVGFFDDRETLLHVHAHGEPPADSERSGPEVPFHFLAPKTGNLKFFVQTQIGGVIRTAQFGFAVE